MGGGGGLAQLRGSKDFPRGEEELGSKVTRCQSLGNMLIKPES